MIRRVSIGGTSPATSAVYPLSGYGFHSASCEAEAATVQSTITGWHVRIAVPAGESITKAAMVVTAAGTLGAGGRNGFAILSDDGQTLLGQTTNDNNLWAVTGLRVATMQATIPADAIRFVRVLPNVEGYSGSPQVAYAVPVHQACLNGTGPLQRRSAFTSGYSGSFPSSINPDTLGTASNFLPFIVLG